MELLVYARNYRRFGAGADEPSRRELGTSIGERVPAFGTGESLCSFVEVRMPGSVVDPSTEIELLVAKAFAVWGHPGGHRVVRFTNARGSVALLLEPGFERARDLCRALQPVLPQARMMLERAQERPLAEARARLEAAARRTVHASAAPSIVVDPNSERVTRLRLSASSRAPARLDG